MSEIRRAVAFTVLLGTRWATIPRPVGVSARWTRPVVPLETDEELEESRRVCPGHVGYDGKNRYEGG